MQTREVPAHAQGERARTGDRVPGAFANHAKRALRVRPEGGLEALRGETPERAVGAAERATSAVGVKRQARRRRAAAVLAAAAPPAAPPGPRATFSALAGRVGVARSGGAGPKEETRRTRRREVLEIIRRRRAANPKPARRLALGADPRRGLLGGGAPRAPGHELRQRVRGGGRAERARPARLGLRVPPSFRRCRQRVLRLPPSVGDEHLGHEAVSHARASVPQHHAGLAPGDQPGGALERDPPVPLAAVIRIFFASRLRRIFIIRFVVVILLARRWVGHLPLAEPEPGREERGFLLREPPGRGGGRAERQSSRGDGETLRARVQSGAFWLFRRVVK